MVRIVLDTNVIISAIIFGGNPRVIIEHAIRARIKLCISEPILNELKHVLQRPKFGFPPQITDLIASELVSISEMIKPVKKISKLTVEPEDNRILECAVEAKVHYIITGDAHLLELSKFKGIRIVTPAQFMNEIETIL